MTTRRAKSHDVRRLVWPAVGVTVGAVMLLLLALAAPASAHPLSTSAVLLDVGTDQVTATIELPLDQLSVALDQELTADNVADRQTLSDLRDYVQDDLSATDTTDRSWTTSVSGGTVEQIDGVDQLVLDATLTPSTGTVGDFVLHYDAILDKLISHRVFVSARYGHSGAYTTLVMLSWQTDSVPVASAASGPPSQAAGFLTAAHLGIEHIRSGSDHLLFLVMLLLPAPLLARGGRWRRRDDLRSGAVRVVHVVTAFAVGHSITLLLGALGLIALPTRLVESGIALSVLVSAIHAIRPLIRRGEALIGVSFGLLHGLSFAAVIGQLGLSRGGLVINLLGFNLGIEVTQLAVVALVMPSLMLLSRTRVYGGFRVLLASTGGVLAGAWLAERVGLITTNPLAPAAELTVEHPWMLAASLGAFALLAVSIPAVRGTEHRVAPTPAGDTAPEPALETALETALS